MKERMVHPNFLSKSEIIEVFLWESNLIMAKRKVRRKKSRTYGKAKRSASARKAWRTRKRKYGKSGTK